MNGLMPGPSVSRLKVESRRPMSHQPTRDTAGPCHRPSPQPSTVHPPYYRFRTRPPCRSSFRLPIGYGISSDGGAAQGGAEASRLANLWRQEHPIGALSRERGHVFCTGRPRPFAADLGSPARLYWCHAAGCASGGCGACRPQ